MNNMATSTIKNYMDGNIEAGNLNVISTAQNVTQNGCSICGNLMEVCFRIKAPSGGFPNNTNLFTMPYYPRSGANIIQFISSDEYMTQNKQQVFAYTSYDSKGLRIGTVPANYWITGHFMTFIDRNR